MDRRFKKAGNAATVCIDTLGQTLVDSIDLALATKHVHWNVRGPRFLMVHEMLDGFRTVLDTHIDEIAERVAQIGGAALGTAQSVAEGSQLAAYPTDCLDESDHLRALAERLRKIGDAANTATPLLSATGDAVSADLLTGYAKALAKMVWMLEAHFGR